MAGGWNGTSNVLTSEISSIGLNGSPEWQLTPGSMSTAHSTGAAVVLQNGKALVCGGYTGSANTGVSEIFDTTSGTWSDVGSMLNGRSYHTATRLQNGKVLVTGGYNGQSNLNVCEVFDPATNTWATTADSLDQGRSYHTATLLKNGKVLIAGGFNPAFGFQLSSAELYDPETNRFSPVPSMANSRAWHAASLLADGRLLVTGGEHFNGGTPFAYDGMKSAEIYDPVANAWSPAADMPAGLSYNAQFSIAGNRVLVIGGLKNTNYSPSFSYEQGESYVYQVETNTWSPFPMNADGRVYFGAALVDSNMVVVAGGIGMSEAEYFAVTTSTAVNQFGNLLAFSVSPNPGSAHGVFRIHTDIEPVTIEITDLSGRTFSPQVSANGAGYCLKLEGFRAGLYMVLAKTAEGRLYKTRLILE